MSKFVLEKYRIFPVFAWGLCIGFSIFVYTLVQDLRASTKELSDTTNRLEQLLNQSPEKINDFSR